MHYIVWLIASGVCFALGEFCSKSWATSRSIFPLTLMFFWYTLGTVLWLPAIAQRNQLSVVGTIWSVLSVLATVGIGVWIFNEHLSWQGWVGIACAVVAVILLGGE